MRQHSFKHRQLSLPCYLRRPAARFKTDGIEALPLCFLHEHASARTDVEHRTRGRERGTKPAEKALLLNGAVFAAVLIIGIPHVFVKPEHVLGKYYKTEAAR